MNDLKKQVSAFIVDNFLFGQDNGLAENASLLDHGIVDSTGIMELVAYLEKTYGITVADDELLPENLDSIDTIASFIERKRG
jgi:acyl carrier protein